MKLFEYIDWIMLIHKLIKESNTGSPEDLSKTLHISPSRLYVFIDELKLLGAPINYSRKSRSYFYTQKFEVHINLDFKLLSEQEIQEINAGFFSKINNSLLFLESE